MGIARYVGLALMLNALDVDSTNRPAVHDSHVALHDVAARKPPSTRLTADDWLWACYTLLAEEGARALKIERLCKQVGATRGSFYWHFDDMESYRAALVDSWQTFCDQDRQSFAEIDTLPPRERLSGLRWSRPGTGC